MLTRTLVDLGLYVKFGPRLGSAAESEQAPMKALQCLLVKL